MNSKQKNEDNLYLDIATRVAEESYAEKLKVGCTIVKDRNIISMGWNGTPQGCDNTCEELVDGKLKTTPYVIHAESNAIVKLATSTGNSQGATLYCTHAPCISCAKLIIQAGITRVVYRHFYGKTIGIDLLKSKIQVEHIPYG